MELPWDLLPQDYFSEFTKSLRKEGFTGPIEYVMVAGYSDSIKKCITEALDPAIVVKPAKPFPRPKIVKRKRRQRGNQVADEFIEEDITLWLKEEPDPQNVMMISGDNDFSKILSAAKKAGHHILAAFQKRNDQDGKHSTDITLIADIFWDNWRKFLSLDPDKKRPAWEPKERKNRGKKPAWKKITKNRVKKPVWEPKERKNRVKKPAWERRKKEEAKDKKKLHRKNRKATWKRKKKEEAKGKKKLHGRYEIPVFGDGNCQFRSLAHHLLGNESLHMQIRREVIEYMSNNPENFMVGMTMQEFRNHLRRMSSNGEWGDNYTLLAAAQNYNVRIWIANSNGSGALYAIYPIGDPTRDDVWVSFDPHLKHYNPLGDS